MTAPDLALLPAIPRDGEGPVFREPWEAQAFAIAVKLHEAGVFTWPEWAEALSQAIRDAGLAGDPDLGATYYHHWLAALERLVQVKGLVGAEALARRKQGWISAYLRTPHGAPVDLAPAERSLA